MTNTEIAQRDHYLAARRARGNVALRECNRLPPRQERRSWSWSFATSTAPPPPVDPVVPAALTG